MVKLGQKQAANDPFLGAACSWSSVITSLGYLGLLKSNSSHWYSLAIAANGSGPSHIRDTVETYTPACLLHFTTAEQLFTPSLWGDPSDHTTKSWLLALLAQQCLNKLPTDIRVAEIRHTIHRRLKSRLLLLYLSPWKEEEEKRPLIKCSTWSSLFVWWIPVLMLVLAIFGLYLHGWMYVL